MKKIIIVRVCEIFLKGNNRPFFLNLLENHIENSLSQIKHRLVKIQMRYLIEDFEADCQETIIGKLLNIFHL